jgi:hypothetical protein
MRFPYAPHANARQARAQARALYRASRVQPFHPRGARLPLSRFIPNLIASVLLIACGGILCVLFGMLYASGQYNTDLPNAALVMQLGCASGLFGFIAGVFMLCVTIDQRTRY